MALEIAAPSHNVCFVPNDSICKYCYKSLVWLKASGFWRSINTVSLLLKSLIQPFFRILSSVAITLSQIWFCSTSSSWKSRAHRWSRRGVDWREELDLSSKSHKMVRLVFNGMGSSRTNDFRVAYRVLVRGARLWKAPNKSHTGKSSPCKTDGFLIAG